MVTPRTRPDLQIPALAPSQALLPIPLGQGPTGLWAPQPLRSSGPRQVTVWDSRRTQRAGTPQSRLPRPRPHAQALPLHMKVALSPEAHSGPRGLQHVRRPAAEARRCRPAATSAPAALELQPLGGIQQLGAPEAGRGELLRGRVQRLHSTQRGAHPPRKPHRDT